MTFSSDLEPSWGLSLLYATFDEFVVRAGTTMIGLAFLYFCLRPRSPFATSSSPPRRRSSSSVMTSMLVSKL